jgi:hypothetical protein
MKTNAYVASHPMVIFWLGMLTGALVVGFIFLYQMVNTEYYQTAIIRNNLLKNVTTTTKTVTNPTTSLQGVGTQAIGGDGFGF